MKLLHPGTTAALVLLYTSLGTPAFAGAVTPPQPSDLTAAKPKPALLCETKTACRPVTMPKQAGVVSQVIKGDFVPGKTSWIAYGAKRASLCYETPAPAQLKSKRSAVTFCTPIATGAPYHDLAVQQRVDGKGRKTLVFTAGPSLQNLPNSTRDAVLNFMAGIERAKTSMAKNVAKPLRTADFGMCNAGEWDMAPICGDGGDTGGMNDYPGGGGFDGGGFDPYLDPDFAARSTGCWPIPGGVECGSRREPTSTGGIPVWWDIPRPDIIPSGPRDGGIDTSPKRSDYGPVYDEQSAVCWAKFEAGQDGCKYLREQGFQNRWESAACYTRVADSYAVCLSNARQAQRDHDRDHPQP